MQCGAINEIKVMNYSQNAYLIFFPQLTMSEMLTELVNEYTHNTIHFELAKTLL